MFTEKFNTSLQLGAISFSPGALRFSGLNNIHNEDYTLCNDADDKFGSLIENALTSQRHKQPDKPMNELERFFSHLRAVSSDGLVLQPPPFFSFCASYLQQRNHYIRVSSLVKQRNILRKLRKLGTSIEYPRHTNDRN